MSSLSDFLAEPRNVIVAGVKRDGRPHLSPNLFFWDGERFFISTTRVRVKYKIFSRDPRIELIIDSLPNHELVESIPIAIDALGDSVFTASMRNVDIAATGNSVGEALLLLKEHIAATFDELNRQLSHLTQDQKTTLQLLHTYIAPLHKKSRWL